MGSTPKPPAPDPALGQAALRQAAIAQEMAATSREQMVHQREQDTRNYALAEEQFKYQQGILDQQMQWATQDRQREMETFRPLQDQIIRDAQGWDRDANVDYRTGQALSDVQQAIGQQNNAVSQQMLNMGVNPMSGRFAGTLRAQAGDNAALQAQAVNSTRGQLLNEAQSLRHSAAGLGNPLLGASYSALTGAGQTAGGLMNPYLQANQMAIGGWQAGMGGMGQASGANQGAFNMYQQQHQNAMDVWRSKMQNRSAMISAGLGLAGAVVGGPLGAGLGSALGGGTFAAGAAGAAGGSTGFLSGLFSPSGRTVDPTTAPIWQ